MSRSRIDGALVTAAAGSLLVAALVSPRWGAIAMGVLFLTAAALRLKGSTSLILTQRRQQTDVVVLSAFALGLIVLALVLP